MVKSPRSTIAKKRLFLQKFSEIGNITKAAEFAGCSRSSVHKNWLKQEDFRRKFEQAKLAAIDNLEAAAYERAVTGVLEPVFYQGDEVGYVRRYSDTLLSLLLKGANPEKYRERYDARLSGADGGPVQLNFYIPKNNREIEAG